MARRKKKQVRYSSFEKTERQIQDTKETKHIETLCDDMAKYMPTFLVAEASEPDNADGADNDLTGRVSFYISRDVPFSPKTSVNIDYYELDKANIELAKQRIKEISASKENVCQTYGYVVPLLEDEFFSDREDVNAYLHNLMFWESLLEYDEYGPAFQHVECLTQIIHNLKEISVNKLRKQEDMYFATQSFSNEITILNRVISHYEDKIRYLNEKLAEKTPRDLRSELQAHYDEIAKIISESRKEYEENAFRNEMLMKQMAEFQELIKEDETRKEHRHEQLSTMESLFQMIKDAGDDDKEQ